jgi:membrane-associated phospholipid phosphatase
VPPKDEHQLPTKQRPHIVRVLSRMRESWRIWLVGFVVIGGASSTFFALAAQVWEHESFPWDGPLMLAAQRAHMPWLDRLMITVTRIGSPGEIVITALGAVVLWSQRRRVASIALVVSVAGAGLLDFWLKLLFARPRPDIFTPLTTETSYSFPSGHTMSAVALYGFVAYLLWREGQRMWAVLAVLFGLLISFSRVYLGVHYPSDILGAITLGVLWLAVVIVGYRHYRG